jgi:hypothetical protein
LNGFIAAFEKYFPKCGKEDHWIASPFRENYFKIAALSVQEKEKLIELKTDSLIEAAFEKKSTIAFWVDAKEECPELPCKAFNVLLTFTNTVLMKKAFSTYTFIKNKYHNKLPVSSDLWIYYSYVESDFSKLSSSKQAQGSH